MKLIDITAYFGKWPHWPISVTTSKALIELMDKWKIDQAVVASLRSVFLNCADGHQELCDLVKEYPKRIIGFAMVSPKDEKSALAQVEQTYKDGCKGLRLFPQHHQYRLDDDPTLEAILNLAQDYNLPVHIPSRIMLHWGLPQLDVREVEGVAARFPKVNFIVGGLNYSEVRDTLGVMRRRSNVFFETSCLQMVRGIETFVEKAGADRVLFGTGLPLQYPSPGIAKIAHAEVSDGDKEKIFGLNAQNLLGLK